MPKGIEVSAKERGWACWLSIVLQTLGAVGCLGVLMGCHPTYSVPMPGYPVSSGEFYTLVMPFYHEMLPPLIQARDLERLYAALPIDRVRYRHQDETGRLSDYPTRAKRIRALFARSLASGDTWRVSIAVNDVYITDATHGVVSWTVTNTQQNSSGDRGRTFRINRLSQWKKRTGQWRIVFTQDVHSTRT